MGFIPFPRALFWVVTTEMFLLIHWYQFTDNKIKTHLPLRVSLRTNLMHLNVIVFYNVKKKDINMTDVWKNTAWFNLLTVSHILLLPGQSLQHATEVEPCKGGLRRSTGGQVRLLSSSEQSSAHLNLCYTAIPFLDLPPPNPITMSDNFERHHLHAQQLYNSWLQHL